MYLIIRGFSRQKSVLHYQRQRQIFRYHLPSLKHECLNYLRDLFSAETCVTQFFCRIINALQTFTDDSVIRIVFFNVGMRERESVIENVCLAEKEIFLSWDKLVLYPFKSFKPYEFYRTCLIGECCAYACHTWFAMSLHIGHCSDKLIVNGIVINLVYLMDFTAVNISEREIFEQVLKREYAEFFIKKFGSFRTYALQEFYFCLKNIDHR